MKIRVIQDGEHIATIDRKSFPYGRRKRAVRYKGNHYGVSKFGSRFSINADRPLRGGKPFIGPIQLPFIGPIQQNPFGIPLWLLLGGGALAAYLFLRSKKASAAPVITGGVISAPDPYGGQAAPTQEFQQGVVDANTFAALCSSTKGIMVAGSCVGAEHHDLGTGKHVLKLMPNGQVFNMTTNQWMYDI